MDISSMSAKGSSDGSISSSSSNYNITTTTYANPNNNNSNNSNNSNGITANNSINTSMANSNNTSTATVKSETPRHHQHCLNCNAIKTPLWRTGPKGPKTLCNACGVKWSKGKKLNKLAAAKQAENNASGSFAATITISGSSNNSETKTTSTTLSTSDTSKPKSAAKKTTKKRASNTKPRNSRIRTYDSNSEDDDDDAYDDDEVDDGEFDDAASNDDNYAPPNRSNIDVKVSPVKYHIRTYINEEEEDDEVENDNSNADYDEEAEEDVQAEIDPNDLELSCFIYPIDTLSPYMRQVLDSINSNRPQPCTLKDLRSIQEELEVLCLSAKKRRKILCNELSKLDAIQGVTSSVFDNSDDDTPGKASRKRARLQNGSSSFDDNQICGVINSRGRPCQRTGFCPFHHKLVRGGDGGSIKTEIKSEYGSDQENDSMDSLQPKLATRIKDKVNNNVIAKQSTQQGGIF
eukprot:GEZU01020908.1.p1 GENE.GEZU01020908.1~~GEZU01020908.1.p1  ORF type:complete len:462 (-),score=141.29 GEZU01020908.1:9-1394(-)